MDYQAAREFIQAIPQWIALWWQEKRRADPAAPEAKASSVEIVGTFNGVKITAKAFAVSVATAGQEAAAEVTRLASAPGLKADGKPAKVSE